MGNWNRSFIAVLLVFAVGCVAIPTTPTQTAVEAQMEAQALEEEEVTSLADEIVDDGSQEPSEEEQEEENRERRDPTPLEIFGIGAVIAGTFLLLGLTLYDGSSFGGGP